MKQKRIGAQTVCFANPPSVIGSACVGGKKEGEGPLGSSFDFISEDAYFGERSWEKAESAMQRLAYFHALNKARLSSSALDYIFAGDLLNQCTASAFSMRDTDVPYFGLYGACSTMAEALSLAAMSIDGGYADHNYVTETVKAANCQERDVTTKYCTVCGKVASTTYGEYGKHQYDYNDDSTITVIHHSSCTESGEYLVACTVCGEQITVYADAEGHEDVDGDGVCDKCGQSMNEGEGSGSSSGTCDLCGRNHAGKEGGFFGYNGFVCRLIALIRRIVKLFSK